MCHVPTRVPSPYANALPVTYCIRYRVTLPLALSLTHAALYLCSAVPVDRNFLRMCKKMEHIDPILRGPINPQYIFQYLESCWQMAERTPSGSAATAPIRPKIDPKMHETAKIVLKPPYMRLDSGALMDSKLHIERVQSFSLRHSDKKPENSFL